MIAVFCTQLRQSIRRQEGRRDVSISAILNSKHSWDFSDTCWSPPSWFHQLKRKYCYFHLIFCPVDLGLHSWHYFVLFKGIEAKVHTPQCLDEEVEDRSGSTRDPVLHEAAQRRQSQLDACSSGVSSPHSATNTQNEAPNSSGKTIICIKIILQYATQWQMLKP